jgi:hypothetical protein
LRKLIDYGELVLADSCKSIGNCAFDKIRRGQMRFSSSWPIVNCGLAGIQRVLSFSAILAFYDICMPPTAAVTMQAANPWPELINLKRGMLN